MPIVAYMTHQLGPKFDTDEWITRQNNVSNSISWARFLIASTDFVIQAPWITNLNIFDEDIHSTRFMLDQLVLMRRSDCLLMVGGRLSPHMRFERQYCIDHKIPVIDAIELGYYPPITDVKWCKWLLDRAQPQIQVP